MYSQGSHAYGRRFDFHDWSAGQRGGLMLYPLSGVLSGLQCTTTNNLAANGSTYQLQIAPGRAKLDGVLVELASALSPTLNLPVPPATGLNVYDVYINPVRKVPAVLTTASPPASPQIGDRILRVVEHGSWQQLQEIQEWTGAVWRKVEPVHGPSEPVPGFSSPRDVLPAEFVSHNNMPLNEVRAVAITAAQVSMQPEKPIYHESGLPPTAPAHMLHWLRQSASLLLCKFELHVVVTPLVVSGTSTSGSSTVTGNFKSLLLLPATVRQALQVTGPGITGTAFVNTVAPDGGSITLDDTSGPGGSAVNAGAGAGPGQFTLTHATITHHLVGHRVLEQQRVLA